MISEEKAFCKFVYTHMLLTFITDNIYRHAMHMTGKNHSSDKQKLFQLSLWQRVSKVCHEIMSSYIII